MKEYCWRWVNFMVFISYSLAMSAYPVTFTTILTQTADHYDVSAFAVNWVFLCTNIGFYVSFYPTSWLIENKGISVCGYVSAAISIFGLWVRLGINTNFYFVVLGTFISSLGSGLYLNAPAKVSETWFKPENRPIITTCIAIPGHFGSIIGN